MILFINELQQIALPGGYLMVSGVLTDINLTNDEIYQILRKEILTLKFLPGDSLSENMLCKRFNVSRTPIRNTIERLKKDNLLVVMPKKGTFVSLIDFEMAEHMMFMRSQIEATVMSSHAANANAQLFQKLRFNLEQQEKIISRDDADIEFFNIDSKFHELCMIACGKRRLWDLFQRMDSDYSRYRLMDYKTIGRLELLYKEHLDIYNAMKNGDSEEIKKKLIYHIYGGMFRIEEFLTNEYKDYFLSGETPIEDILLNVKLYLNSLK